MFLPDTGLSRVTQVIIHPGFHKTGTSTLQASLRANRDTLAPDIRIFLDQDILGLSGAAKGYSASRTDLDLGLVLYEAALIAEQINPAPRTLILSSESLCGYIPGRNGVQDYRAAPDLLTAICTAFAQTRPDAKLTFLFSTRSPEDWLESCYAQHLRASRMKLDKQDYVETFRPSSNLTQVVTDCTAALPLACIASIRLEDCAKTRLGMLDSLLDLADYPDSKRSALSPAPVTNRAPSPAQLSALLDINRSGLSDQDACAARLKLNREIV